MVKPPMDVSDASRRPTAGSEPPTSPQRVIIGDGPNPTRHKKGEKQMKSPEMFSHSKLGEYEIGPSFDGMLTFMISMAAVLLALLVITILQDRKNHYPLLSSPPICARGYEI